MFIESKRVTTQYTRTSKLQKTHTYSKTKTIAVFQCDNCNQVFERDLGRMDRKRLSNNYYHVCENCNSKQFAQRKGAERRALWNLPVDSDKNIGRI